MKTVQVYYDDMPSLNVIWDLTEADPTSITAYEIRAMAKNVKKLSHSREGGKTAIISPKDISYGLSRMYQTYAEIFAQIINVEVFRSRLEAERWLGDK